MERFDVYALPGGNDRFVVNVQSDFLSHLTTRVVIPLFPEGEIAEPSAGLNPIVELGSERFTVFTQLIVAVPKSDLRRRVNSLSDQQDEITRAMDILFTGF